MRPSTAQAAVISAAVAIVVGGTTFIGPPESVTRERPSRTEPVVRSTSVCPYVGGEPRATSRLGVFAVPGVEEPAPVEPDGEPSPGSEKSGPPAVTAQALTPAGAEQPKQAPRPVLSLPERGKLAVTEVNTAEPRGYAVRAQGPLAPGVVAEQWMLAEGPDLRGLVAGACTSPGAEHWFVGGSAGTGQRGRLVLSNPSNQPALVSLDLWTEAGPLSAPGTKDITIPGNGQEIRLLDALAPGSGHVAVRVSATRGKVAAAVDYRERNGPEPRGVTMVPATAAPSVNVVVPGVPGHGERSLRILAPGETDAIVSLRVLGPQGPFSPVGPDVVTVPAGSVVDVPITEAVGNAPAAIELKSDVPVTAAVRVVDAGSGQPDIGYTAAVAPLPEQPVPALLGAGAPNLSTKLLLTAVEAAGARVSVRRVAADGSLGEEQTVDVPAGSTVPLELGPAEGDGVVTVLVEPVAAGTVVAVREIAGTGDEGATLDLMPLVSSPTAVEVPEVAGELPTGLEPPSAR